MRAPRRSDGFTLLEIMIVLGIFSVLAVMAYGGLASVLNARTQVSESLDRTVELQKAYLTLRNDFQQVRDRGIRDNFDVQQPSLSLNRDGGVEFTRGGWRNPLSAARSTLERVSYHLDDKHQLIRAHWRVLDRAPQSEPLELPILTQVETADFRFLDNAQAWQTTWPMMGATGVPPVNAPPPRAVELTLHLKDIGPVRLFFSANNTPWP